MSDIIDEITEHGDELGDLSSQLLSAIRAKEISSEALEAFFESLAEMVDGSVYQGYSGRGMYGKTCWGISGDNLAAILEMAGRYGLSGASWDSLGLEYIVYWPRIPYIEAE
jgi:hypothetical protein